MRNPATPSVKVMSAAGHNVEDERTVAATIWLGDAIIVTGGCVASTQICQTATIVTTAAIVGQYRRMA